MILPKWHLVGCACVLGAGCRSTAVDAPTSSSAATPVSAAVSTSSAPVTSGSTRAPKLPHAFERGCAGDVDASQTLDEQLDAMGAACSSGLARMNVAGEPLALSADEPRRIEVEVAAHACIRVGIVSSTAGAALQVALLGPDGERLGGSLRGHAPMLMPQRGPVCTNAAGRHGIEVTSLGADATARAGVWVTTPSAAPDAK